MQQTEQLSSGTVSSTTRVYSYDGGGQILGRTDGTVSGSGSSATFTPLAGATTANPDALAPQHYIYAEGHSLATLGANGTIQLSDGLSAPAATASSNAYTVQAGDTLQSIAQSVYGNSSLWYVIADANALSLDSSGNAINLVAGTTLKLPAVRNEQNGSQTFDPYNPLQRIGSTTPALAYIPPPPQQHCNTLADLIVVAVTAFLAPEMEPYLAASLGGSAVAGWAAAGFAANTAGQLGADAVGVSNGYSFSAAVIAGIGDGVTGPLSAGLASQGDSFSIWANSAGQLEPAGEAVLGAANYAASVAAARIVGEPTQFSWAGMAAAALGASAATATGLPSANDVALGQGQSLAADFAGGVLDSAVTREASLALGDHRVPSWKQIGIDAFGNALGDSAAKWISDEEWKQVAPSAQKAADTLVSGIMGGGSGTSTSGSGNAWLGVPYAYPAPNGGASATATPNGTIPLPNGDMVLPDGTVLAGNGTGPVQYLLPVNDRPSPVTAFWNGDPKVLPALLKGQDPATLTWNTPNFDPTAPVQLDLGYGVDNAAVNAAIAKSPILTAGLNEAFANGFSVQLVVPGGEDVPPTSATYGVIAIPAQYANNPTAIVSTLAHELGHVLWGGSNQISYTQFVNEHMSEPQFVQAQTARYLQGEGVATLTNIAVAEQIWPLGPNGSFANLPVNGIQANKQAPQIFEAAFTAFSNGSESLAQAASAIGSFYSANEKPGNDLGETYGAMYSRDAQTQYTSYANRLNVTNATLQFQKFQNRELQWQQLNALRANAISNPREEPAYEQALRIYESGNGGGQ